MKNLDRTESEIKSEFKKIKETHKIWHKFQKFITKTYGKDLYGEEIVNEFVDANGKKRKFKYRNFNEVELSRRLVGYEVMERIEKYIKKSIPEIKIVRCDDSYHAGSDLLLVPHPGHGITIIFIPQLTGVQNQFFLYEGHYKMLMSALKEMSGVYKEK